MRTAHLFILAFLLVSFRMTAQDGPAISNGQLKVCRGKLCNDKGKNIQLRGLSTHGLQWYGWDNCLTKTSISVMKHWGADVIRVVVYPREGGFNVQPEKLMKQVVTIVDECTKLGLYVIVDWHQRKPGDPNVDIEMAKLFFSFVSERYRDSKNVLYEICNEPNGIPWVRIKKYADVIIPLIRKHSPDAVILVGTPGWSSFGVADGSNSSAILGNPLAYENIMYTFHFYARHHRDQYLSELARASEQIPIFVTEFGFQEASGDGKDDVEMSQRYVDLLKENKISWVYWNFSDNVRTGAVWLPGSCKSASFDDAHLKPSGLLIKKNLEQPKDDF